jgi:hypothetical protein
MTDLVASNITKNRADLWLNTRIGQWYLDNYNDDDIVVCGDFYDMKSNEKRYSNIITFEEDFLKQLDTDGIECKGADVPVLKYPWVIREDTESRYKYLIYSKVIEPYQRTIREYIKRVYYSEFIASSEVHAFNEKTINQLLNCTLVDRGEVTDFAKSRSYIKGINYNPSCTCNEYGTEQNHHSLCGGILTGPPRTHGAYQRRNLAEWEDLVTQYLLAWMNSYTKTVEELREDIHNELLNNTSEEYQEMLDNIISEELEKLAVELNTTVDLVPTTLRDVLERAVRRENPLVVKEMSEYELITQVFTTLGIEVERSCVGLLEKADEFLSLP